MRIKKPGLNGGAAFQGAGVHSLAICAGVVVLAAAGVAQAPPQRTGIILGQVVDGTTSAPVGDAVVTLTKRGNTGPTGFPLSERVITDEEGRFFFSPLDAGDYLFLASKEGFIRGGYAQRAPWEPALPLTLGEGERITDITLRVWKYSVIGGTVLDEAREPIVGIAVRALPRESHAGRTRFGNNQVIEELVPSAVTDDRGMFRLTQLAPGTYVVVVPSTHTTVPARALAAADTSLRNDLFMAGVSELTPLGQPRTVQLGEFALMSLNRVVIPPPPDASGRMQVYRATYFPAAQSPAAATPVTVKAGEERTDITINLQPVPAMSIHGRLVTPDGSPAPRTLLRLVGEAMNGVATGIGSGSGVVGLDVGTAVSDGSGRFAFLGVPRGNYVLKQAAAYLIREAQQGRVPYWVSQPVAVGTQDIADLVVELRPALRLEGKLEFRAGASTDAPPLGVGGVTFETPFGEPGQVFASVDRESSSFGTVAAAGRFIARPVQTGGWFVHSVTLDGRDVTDKVIDLQSDATSFVVTYTNRPSKVSGTVTDASGARSTTAAVLAFPVDRQGWSGYGSSPRTLRQVLTNRTGAFMIDHLPPGDYYVIAVEGAETTGWRDPARLEAYSTDATRLSIAGGDAPRTLDLRVGRPR